MNDHAQEGSWIRIDQTHRLRNDGKGGPGEEDFALARRIYGLDGNLFPRITLTIYPDHRSAILKPLDWVEARERGTPVCVHIGADILIRSGHVWQECGIPVALLPDIAEMIAGVEGLTG